jgi:hypothetical protein
VVNAWSSTCRSSKEAQRRARQNSNDENGGAMSKASYVRREVAKGQSRPHHCHAFECERQVPPAYFMCTKHWRLVPRRPQAAVWRHYNPGQEKGEADVSAEYLRVADEAIQAVAEAEGKSTPRPATSERQLTLDDLTPHDRAEVERFTDYLKRLPAARAAGANAVKELYAEFYGNDSP